MMKYLKNMGECLLFIVGMSAYFACLISTSVVMSIGLEVFIGVPEFASFMASVVIYGAVTCGAFATIIEEM